MCGKMVENFARLEQLGQNPLYQTAWKLKFDSILF